jgi:hypothetical protein
MFAKQNAVFNYISTSYIKFLLFLSCTEKFDIQLASSINAAIPSPSGEGKREY